MRYIPIEGAVRRWRESLELTVTALVRVTRGRVSERTIRQLESAQPQKYLQAATVGELAKAFSRGSGKTCLPEHLAWHQRSDGHIQMPASPDPTLAGAAPPPLPADLLPTSAPAPTPATTQAARRARKEQVAASLLPANTEPAEKLGRAFIHRLALEKAVGRHADTVKLGDSSYPLVGLQLLHEIEQVYMEKEGQQFAVAGYVLDQRAIAPKVAAELGGAELGRGAGYFLIAREVHGQTEAGEDQSLKVYPTVYAPAGSHGKLLTKCLHEKLPVTVVVKVITTTARPGTGEDRWAGFFGLEPGRPKPRGWAFVAVEVFVGEGETVMTKRRGATKAAVFAPGAVRIR